MPPLPCPVLHGHHTRTQALNLCACIIPLHSRQPPFEPLPAFLPGPFPQASCCSCCCPSATTPPSSGAHAVLLAASLLRVRLPVKLCAQMGAACCSLLGAGLQPAAQHAHCCLRPTANTHLNSCDLAACPAWLLCVPPPPLPLGATCCALLPRCRWQTGADRFNSYCDKNKNLARLISGAAVAGLQGGSYHRH